MADTSSDQGGPVQNGSDKNGSNRPRRRSILGFRKKTVADVDFTRAWTGLYVVIFGDVAIAVAAIYGVVRLGSTTGSTNGPLVVSILTSAFTAVGTMTTAYFGI